MGAVMVVVKSGNPPAVTAGVVMGVELLLPVLVVGSPPPLTTAAGTVKGVPT